MSADAGAPAGRERILSPMERQSEIIFGLIMALSFTGSISVAESGQEDIRLMLVAALGCNTAWGLVDAVMYLVTTLVERQRGSTLLRSVREESDAERARGMIADSLPPLVAASIRTPELEHVRAALAGLTDQPRARLTGRDFLGALGVFLLVFLSTLPVAIPFLLPIEALRALRISNGVAIAMLFVMGWRLARYAGTRPLAMASAMVAIGVALVGATLALGG
jgi:hypothetical protein